MSDSPSALLTQLDELYDYLLSDKYSEDELEMLYPIGKNKYGKYTVVGAALTQTVNTILLSEMCAAERLTDNRAT
jgi:hypothetical protein